MNKIIIIAYIVIFVSQFISCNKTDDEVQESMAISYQSIKEDKNDKVLKLLDRNQKLLISTRAASPLVRGFMHQLQEGEPWAFNLIFNVDDAQRAVIDGVALGAFYLHLKTQNSLAKLPHNSKSFKSLTHYQVATSELWWTHAGSMMTISSKEWKALLMGNIDHWPHGESFQLCLRASPDPLEQLWIQDHPQFGPLLRTARQSGRWPIFKDDEQLIHYLLAHPGAIALFTAGNLRLRGAPLSQMKIANTQTTQVNMSLVLKDDPTVLDDFPNLTNHLKRITQILSETERSNLVYEWGWRP